MPIFLVVLGASAAALFNHQKASSSVVASTLYALRIHPKAREILGEEISFKNKMPWIGGKLSQLHGDIDISYRVKGTKGEGLMRFKSVRTTRLGLVGTLPSPCYICCGAFLTHETQSQFETLRWDLVMDDGHILVLLEITEADPFPQPQSS